MWCSGNVSGMPTLDGRFWPKAVMLFESNGTALRFSVILRDVTVSSANGESTHKLEYP